MDFRSVLITTESEETMDNRRGGFRRDQGPREMHKAVCAECKEECEVPFKPSNNRPVYCKNCYANHRSY